MLVRDSLQVATSNARRQRERTGAAPKLLKRRVVRSPPPIAAGALPRGTLRASDPAPCSMPPSPPMPAMRFFAFSARTSGSYAMPPASLMAA